MDPRSGRSSSMNRAQNYRRNRDGAYHGTIPRQFKEVLSSFSRSPFPFVPLSFYICRYLGRRGGPVTRGGSHESHSPCIRRTSHAPGSHPGTLGRPHRKGGLDGDGCIPGRSQGAALRERRQRGRRPAPGRRAARSFPAGTQRPSGRGLGRGHRRVDGLRQRLRIRGGLRPSPSCASTPRRRGVPLLHLRALTQHSRRRRRRGRRGGPYRRVHGRGRRRVGKARGLPARRAGPVHPPGPGDASPPGSCHL